MRRQQTLSTSMMISGVGVHSGAPATARLLPAPVNHGLAFVRADRVGAAPIAAHIRNLAATPQCTTLRGKDGSEVATVEHLMAAAAALGVDNLLVEIDGPEVPILDGSAAPFAEAMRAAGLRSQAAPRRRLRVRERVEVRDGARWAALEPSDIAEIDVTIRYDDPAIGLQRCLVRPGLDDLAAELLQARTFGFLRDVERFRAMGLALGSSLDNTVAVDAGRIVNPEGLRYPNEFARHKALDALGDLALAGAPILGRFVAEQTGHALNAALVRTLLATPGAWVWEVEPTPEREAALAFA